MNSRQKGRKSELLAKKKLEDKGWLCYMPPPPSRYHKGVDILGCWDLLCVKEGLFKLVQVKTNQWHDLRECKAFKEEYFHNHDFCSCEIWMWKTKEKEWRVRKL